MACAIASGSASQVAVDVSTSVSRKVTVPAGSDWIHEYKYDGYRLLIAVGEGAAVAWTRYGKDWSHRFARLVEAAAKPFPAGTLIDGEAAISPGWNRIFATIWDGGGIDTYDLSRYKGGLDIDLAPGGCSTFSAAQCADLGGGPNGGLARGNIFNALQYRHDPRSLIENAIGGQGNDSIAGNSAGRAPGESWIQYSLIPAKAAAM